MEMEGYRPKTLKEALELKARLGKSLAVVAGGTDFMVSLKLGAAPPDGIMDITGIEELRAIRLERGALVIGACATFSEIAESGLVAERAPVLLGAAQQIGARQIRNMATLGGNVATCSPAGDSLPALWVLDAHVLMAGKRGTRKIGIRKFNPCYRTTELGPDEIVAALVIPETKGAYESAFFKVGPRKAQAISKVSLACMARLKGRTLQDVRFAAGSVGPVVVGLSRTEKYLRGKRPGVRVIEKARQTAMAEISPIDDVRSTALYRKTVTGNLVARFLRDLQSL
jgi:CO/xanthine dehydrogenase FAD-binding subunit